MKIKGICKDCQFRWQLGAKGKPQHLYCCRSGNEHIVKNINMQSCPHYQKASEDQMKTIKNRSQGR